MNLEKLEFAPVTLDDVCIGADNKNDSGIHRHFHPYWELKVYEFDGRTRIVMTPPGEVHGQTPRELLTKGWVLHCLEPMLDLSFFSLSSGTTDNFFPWDEADALCPGGLLELIEAIAHAKKSHADARLLSGLLETLWSVIFQVWQRWRGRPVRTSSLADMARYYIERNYYLPSLTVESVASHLGVTAGHLANLFKKDGSTTVRQYIVKIRMNHALRLLRSGCYTVKETADMTGWSCQFYFSNCFRRHFGVMPSKASNLINDAAYMTL